MAKKKINDAVIGISQSDLVQKHGEGASQYIQALDGKRYDATGKELAYSGRSLREISNYRKDINNPNVSIKQQSGFDAELIKEARDNQKNIINGDSSRTRTTDGLGETNNTKYDHKIVNSKNQEMADSGSQMKFLGEITRKNGTTYTVIEKMVKDPSWDRYDTVIDVPKDQYDNLLKYADEQEAKYHQQAERLRQKGNLELANEKDEIAEKYRNTKSRIRQSDVTQDEAILAREHPDLYVHKEVLKSAHEAGVIAAQNAAIISGSISIAQNIYEVIVNDKPIDEAAADVVTTVGESSTVGYVIGNGGSILKSVMHSSKDELVRKIGTTNAPAMIATAVVDVAKSLSKYASGEIDELELVEELGQKGTGLLAAGYASTAGTMIGASIGSAIPIVGTLAGAAVGGFIGSMIGYSSSSMLYQGALNALKNEKISEERRQTIEALAEQTLQEMSKYKQKLEELSVEKYAERATNISAFFDNVEQSIADNNIDMYIVSVNKMANSLDLKLQFKTREEIDCFMRNPDTVFEL